MESGAGFWLRLRGGGAAQVADDAGGGPGVGEGGAGLGFAETQDEAVHLLEELADFLEPRPEGDVSARRRKIAAAGSAMLSSKSASSLASWAAMKSVSALTIGPSWAARAK